MASKEVEKLEQKRAHIRTQLDRTKKANEIVPWLQDELERTEWELAALLNQPEEASEIPLAGLITKLDNDLKSMVQAVPLMPEYDAMTFYRATGYTTSGSAGVYEYVTRVGQLGTPQAQVYSMKFAGLYQDLQVKQERPKKVRDLLERLGAPNLLERFDRAVIAFSSAKADKDKRTSAATEVRNLLSGLEGELFARARQWPNENMTWEEMASRLSTDGRDELIDQKRKCSLLMSDLGDIVHDRGGKKVIDLDDVWTRALDHISIILGLVRLP